MKPLTRQQLAQNTWLASPAALAASLSKGRWWRAPHLNLLSRWLVEAALGKRKRLIVSMPPRHGKSETCSHWFPVWYLNLFPDRRVMLGSYEAGFASEWGRKVRNTIWENEASLRLRLTGDSTAADHWTTTDGGSMSTSGVGGPMTGRGANLLIIDDPVKNGDEANSQTYRDKTWNWWSSTAYTRLEPGAIVVVIMTRWHEDDLAGRLLAQSDAGGEHWDSLCLSAMAEGNDPLGRADGEALWAERYDKTQLQRIQGAVGSRVWSALFQQRPASAESAIFKPEWWRFWRHSWEPESTDEKIRARTVLLPEAFDDEVLSVDCSFKKTDTSDYVASGHWCHKGADSYLMPDLVWDRMGFIETVERVRDQRASAPRVSAVLIEDKANGPAVIDVLKRDVPGVVPINPEGGKEARGAATSPQVEAGQVFLPLHAPWTQRYIHEHTQFPKGQHDDAVDQQSQALLRRKTKIVRKRAPMMFLGPDGPTL